MAQWYFQEAAEEKGPFSPSQLLDLVRRGVVVRETKLRKDDSAWFAAAEVGGLFEAAVKPTVRFRCPTCGGDVSQPPCHCPKCGRDLDVARREVIQHQIESSRSANGKPVTPNASMQSWLNRFRSRRGD